MTQHQAWITVDECINSYLNRSEQSNHKYFKLWHLAFEALTELGLDAFYIIKAIKIPVNSNLTATLPPDYLQYSKVGVLNQQGEIITMGDNNKLTTAYDLNPTRLQQNQDDTIQTEAGENGIMWYNYWSGNGFGNIYGLPSGQPFIGSFKIDNANGVIVLSENFSYPYVMLEYVSSPTEGGDYYVPIQFKKAVVAYLAWNDIIDIPVKTHMMNASVDRRRRDYFNERRIAKLRYDPVNIPDLYEWDLQNQRLAVKS